MAKDDKIIDAEAEPLEARPMPDARARLQRWLYIFLLLLAIAIGGAAGLHFLTRPTQPVVAQGGAAQPAPRALPERSIAQDTATQQRIADLERRIASLGSALERLGQLPAANAGDDGRLKNLEGSQDALKESAASLDQRLAALERRLADLAQAQSGQAEKQMAQAQKLDELSRQREASLRQPLALLISFDRLREKARRGERFTAEALALNENIALAQAESLREKFRPLQNAAARGVPSETRLLISFAAAREMAAEQGLVVDAAAGGAPEKPWWQRMMDRLAKLITIRRVGSGATQDDRISDAASAAFSGDLAAASHALAQEADPLPQALQDWLTDAQARLALDQALNAFAEAMAQHFATQP